MPDNPAPDPLEDLVSPPPHSALGDLGLVMGGGGARAAYQVGFLRSLARRRPDLRIPYITGVSAGAINAALLASHHGTFLQAAEELVGLWGRLTVEDVFRVDGRSLLANALNWARQLISGGMGGPPRVRGLVDTQPLRTYLSEVLHAVDGELTGVRYNLESDRLKAVAISTSSYSTGQSVTWVQGEDIKEWERPQRRARNTTLTVEHVMASAALPLFFPAVRLNNGWFGDGGVRLTAPLSPALHLGARRVLAISTRYARTSAEADEPAIYGYPPPAQVLGVLMNSIFLDLLDVDAMRLDRLNRLLEALPEERREGLRTVKLLVARPSVDLGMLAKQYEPRLPTAFRFLTRGLGTRQTRSPDFLSLVLFQPDYLHALMDIGGADADARADEIIRFIDDGPRG
ncbi:MAG TPA: patatin-like phospholipase family protein [Longimicrobiales bacterium]|nr:patatin-like phospholipase family protein [Longimicrobiales bacterium]